MKGIAKIQLIDAVNGQVKFEKIENNIVTDNLNSILNFLGKRLYNKLVSISIPSNIIDKEFEDIFGGIMLLNEVQSLTAKFPKGNVIGIGSKAESIQNTADTSRDGSFIPSESGIVAGGYKFVWQWGQNEGNGVTNSIALTLPNFHDNQAIDFDFSFARQQIIGQNKGFPQYSISLFYDYEENILYFAKDDDILYKLDIKKTIGFNKKQSDNYFLGNAEILNDTDIVSGEIRSGTAITKYNNEIIVGVTNTSNELKLMRFDKSTGAFLGQFGTSITIVNYTYNGCFDINDNYIAVMTDYASKKIEIFNHSGVLQRTIILPLTLYVDSKSIRFIPNTDEILFTSNDMYSSSDNENVLIKLNCSDGSIQLVEKGATIPGINDTLCSICSSLDYPVIFGTGKYSGSGNEYTLSTIAPLIMLTINNLTSPITKTSADILKVEYTVIET